jgi:AcrR family transcriptional regulator
MPELAKRALVSEVTAYRYFPDLRSLLSEAITDMWPTAAEALALVSDSSDPVERVSQASQVLLRGILAYQGGVRAMIAATITQPALAKTRPDVRFELIDEALKTDLDPVIRQRLRQHLVVVVSAENLFCLTDHLNVDPMMPSTSSSRSPPLSPGQRWSAGSWPEAEARQLHLFDGLDAQSSSYASTEPARSKNTVCPSPGRGVALSHIRRSIGMDLGDRTPNPRIKS